VRRSLSVVALSSLLLAAGCSTGEREASKPEAKTLEVAFCSIEKGTFIDANNDGQFDVGDTVSYKLVVAKTSDDGGCDDSDGSFFGIEQVVERRDVDGEDVFLTSAQGTFVFKDGNLQVRSMGHLQADAAQMQVMTETGAMDLAISDIIPVKHQATVVGQGGIYAGFVGTAMFIPGNPPVAEFKLFNRFGS
tara:strand:- start:188 stop:760 length:573 start_codon:yes stop_codon:yes gene_type:complete